MSEQMNNSVIEPSKPCCHCKEVKLSSEFYKDKHSKDGLTYKCKACFRKNQIKNKEKISLYNKRHHLEHKTEINLRVKQHRLEHKDEIKILDHQYRFKNKDKIRERVHQHYLEHKNEIKIYNKIYNIVHRDEISVHQKQHRLEHKDELKLKNKQHRLEHREEINKRQNKRRKQQIETNCIFRIYENYRVRIKQACKSQGIKKPMHTVKLLGCTAVFFQNYLQSRFKHGMTLENNAKRKWVKHHLMSFDSVDLGDIEQLKKVCHYTNIVPMWEDEHIEFHRRYGNKTTREQYEEFMKENMKPI